MQTFSKLSGPITKADMAEFEATLNAPEPVEEPVIVLEQPQTPEPEPAEPTPSIPPDIQAELDKLNKRISDKDAYISQLKTNSSKREKELLDEIKKATTTNFKYVSPEALKGFEEAFPDFAPFLKEYNERTKREAKEEALAETKAMLAERDQRDQENSVALKRLAQRHPDYNEYIFDTSPGGAAFAKWLEGQTQLINDMVTSGEVEKLILVLDLFKSQALGAKPAKTSGKQKELTQAVQPTTPANVAVTPTAFDFKKWNADWDKAVKRSNQKKMDELLLDYELAVKEGRIPR